MYVISHWVYFPFSPFCFRERKMPSKTFPQARVCQLQFHKSDYWFWFIPTQKRNNVLEEEAAGKAFLVRHQCFAKDTIWNFLARRAWTDSCVMADLGDILDIWMHFLQHYLQSCILKLRASRYYVLTRQDICQKKIRDRNFRRKKLRQKMPMSQYLLMCYNALKLKWAVFHTLFKF